MARYLYSELSSLIQARTNCLARMAKMPASVDTKEESTFDGLSDWANRHEELAEHLVNDHLPSGSGFDSGTKLDWDASHAEKLVFTTAFHHMNDNGYYDGWTEHTVTITPSLAHGFNMRVSGRNRNDIKSYIYDCFGSALQTNVEWDIVQTWPRCAELGVSIQSRWIDQSRMVLDVVKGAFGPKELIATFDSYNMHDLARACAVTAVRGY